MKLNKNIAIGVIAIGALYAIYTVYQKKQALDQIEILKARNNNNIPNSGDDWKRWIYLIISIYGTAKTLWEPGGIFYNTNVPPPDASGKLENILNEAKNLV